MPDEMTTKQKEQLKRLKQSRDQLSAERRKKLKDLLKRRKKKKDGVISFKELERMQKRKPKVMEAKKGGSAKFPDLSGDGKVTQKDILMGRGVIKRKKGGPVDTPSKKKSLAARAAELIKRQLKKRRTMLEFVKTGPVQIPRPKLPKPKKPGEPNIVGKPKLPKPSDQNRPRKMKPLRRKNPRRKMATGGVAGRLAKRGYGKAR
tara:strand:+ start:135 stop:746 length:612 start_codon:yes stop_codon:yes gene_type:complete